MNFNISKRNSPIGELLVVTDQLQQIRALGFGDQEPHLHRGLRARYDQYQLTEIPIPAAIDEPFRSYFDGDFVALDKLTIVTEGTVLQRQVWTALREIPAGQTTTYSALAASLGYDEPRMAQAIGAAAAANPIAIVIPCHRVIGKGWDLRGFAWGLHRKSWLLSHENALPTQRGADVDGASRIAGNQSA